MLKVNVTFRRCINHRRHFTAVIKYLLNFIVQNICISTSDLVIYFFYSIEVVLLSKTCQWIIWAFN